MQGRLRRRRWKRWCRWQLMMHAVSEIRLQHASHACFPNMTWAPKERLNRSIKLQAAGPLSSASWPWSMEFR
ncbi:hypothetical protein PVAP13_3NG234763 [Panicum virgatum]|uniref:Uncharacterized protein n=1 Tax=Panicum virgatum TaxID=38727 RepID=A0A8T0UBC7_PANVG|nr:hypothetical protein PVAP13_3NG234763 [Panicum virgatum]